MKKTLTLLLVFLAWTTSLSAQNKREQADIPQRVASSDLPIITPEKIWDVESGSACPEAVGTLCFCYQGILKLKIGNMKIFNEKEYYELLSNDDPPQWKIATYVREEERKLFFYSEYCDKEYLMYDFNLNVGDDVYLVDPLIPFSVSQHSDICELTEEDMDYFKCKITEVDEIEYDQVKRKRLKVEHYYSNKTGFWIEGIGSMKGIVYQVSSVSMGGVWQLKNCYVSDKLIFVNENPEYCWVPTSTYDIQQTLINIFADENNTLHIVNAKDIPLTMYDIQGRNIKSIFPSDDNYTINISNLPKGLYIVGNETKGIAFKVMVR